MYTSTPPSCSRTKHAHPVHESLYQGLAQTEQTANSVICWYRNHTPTLAIHSLVYTHRSGNDVSLHGAPASRPASESIRIQRTAPPHPASDAGSVLPCRRSCENELKTGRGHAADGPGV